MGSTSAFGCNSPMKFAQPFGAAKLLLFCDMCKFYNYQFVNLPFCKLLKMSVCDV